MRGSGPIAQGTNGWWGSAAPATLAVVGGGITGLAAALAARDQAARQGAAVDIVILEAGRRLGGKVATDRVGNLTVEQGPDSFLARKPWARELCCALGLGDELVGGPAARTTYVALGRRLVPLPQGLYLVAPGSVAGLVQSPLFSPWGKLRALLDLVLPPGPPGDESLGALVRRRLGREVAERLAGPLLGGIYGGHIDDLSVLATFPELKAMEQRHGSLIRAALAARQRQAEGAPRAGGAATGGAAGTAAGTHAAGDAAPGGAATHAFLTLRRGLGSLVAAAADHLAGVRVVTGAAVTGVTPLPGYGGGAGAAGPDAPGLGCAPGLGGGRPRYRLHLAGGGHLDAAAVVWATPAFATAAALERVAPDAAAILGAIPYHDAAVVALAYAPGTATPVHGSGFIVAYGSGRSISACTFVSGKWPHHSPDRLLLRAFASHEGDALRLPDAELVAAVRRDLHDLLGLAAAPEWVRVYRWPRAMPQYRVGHLDRVAAAEAALAHLPGHFLAGAAYRGVGLPDCIRQGQEAGARAVAYLVGRAAV